MTVSKAKFNPTMARKLDNNQYVKQIVSLSYSKTTKFKI